MNTRREEGQKTMFDKTGGDIQHLGSSSLLHRDKAYVRLTGDLLEFKINHITGPIPLTSTACSQTADLRKYRSAASLFLNVP